MREDGDGGHATVGKCDAIGGEEDRSIPVLVEGDDATGASDEEKTKISSRWQWDSCAKMIVRLDDDGGIGGSDGAREAPGALGDDDKIGSEENDTVFF